MKQALDSNRPPTLQAQAAQRWWRELHAQADAPWLHQEVAGRMLERLDLLKLAPGPRLLWEPPLAGHEASRAFSQRVGQVGAAFLTAEQPFFEENQGDVQLFWARDAIKSIANTSANQPAFLRQTWSALRAWAAPAAAPAQLSLSHALQAANAQLIWSNLLLHAHPEPARLIAQWHVALATGGCAMFSALGVDTGKEIARLHAKLGLGPSAAQLTDMHDWGDMLVAAGFADPVMDMEHLTLTYSTADALLADWRLFGRNAHVARFAGLRSPRWLARYKAGLTEALMGKGGALEVTVELIYGHAFKPEPRAMISAESAISMREMRQMLSKRR